MSFVIAGDGGSGIVAAISAPARPSALLLEGLARPLTIEGMPALPIGQWPDPAGIDEVVLVGAEAATLESVRGWAAGHALPVREAAVEPLEAPDGVRVVAVSACTTGSGKSALARKVARTLHRSSVRVAVVRHPLPSAAGWPGRSGVRVLEAAGDPDGPIDEREEIEPLVALGIPVVTGWEPVAVLAAAAARASVVVWEGGGAAEPWVRPDLHLLAVDLVRPLPPGAADRLRGADIVVMTKAESAPPQRARDTEAEVRRHNPSARVFVADMPIAVSEGAALTDRRIVIVEDWPSLGFGGLKAGAGAVAARRFRCGVVDPRPTAVGAVREALEAHPHIGPVIPSLGRTPEEIDDLRESVAATPGEAILWASPADPGGLLEPQPRPVIRVTAELVEMAGGSLQDVLHV